VRCGWADNILVVETDGWSRPCCGEPSVGSRIQKLQGATPLQSAWDDPKLVYLRQQLQNGYSKLTDPWCRRCKQVEATGNKSLRTGQKILGNPGELKALQFKLSNTCQLACGHCGESLSSQHHKYTHGGTGVIRATDNIDPIIHDVATLLPQLEWIKFTGGEPWHDRDHWRILEGIEHLDRSHCELRYITNALSKVKQTLWQGWRNVQIDISIDGLFDRYEWFRQNAKWDRLYEKYNYYVDQGYDVSINYSITPWTIEDYSEACEMFTNIKSNIVTYPSTSNVANIPNGLLALPKDTPGLNMLNGDQETLSQLRSWAEVWDTRWNQIGKSKQLYPWLVQ